MTVFSWEWATCVILTLFPMGLFIKETYILDLIGVTASGQAGVEWFIPSPFKGRVFELKGFKRHLIKPL